MNLNDSNWSLSNKSEFHQRNSSNETSVTFIKEPYLYLEEHYGWMVITALVIGLAALIGTLGNILIILAVCCVRALRTCGNVFVLNLALADMIVTLLIDPFNVVGAVAGRQVMLGNPTLCNWVASFCGPACLSSMWNMCAISLNRYVLICKPHLYPKIFTFKSTILICISIWILAHLLHMPNHIGWGENRFNPEYYICTFDIATHSYGVFYIVTGVVIPLIGVLFGYSAIFLKVRKVKRQIRQQRLAMLISDSAAAALRQSSDNPVKAPKQKKIKIPMIKPGFTHDDVKLAKTLFAAFLVFLLSWFLVVVFVLGNDPPGIPGWLYVVAVIMAHGNSAVNPVLYGMTNERFRDGYRTVLCFNRHTIGDKLTVTKKETGHSYGQRSLPADSSISKIDRTSTRAVPSTTQQTSSII